VLISYPGKNTCDDNSPASGHEAMPDLDSEFYCDGDLPAIPLRLGNGGAPTAATEATLEKIQKHLLKNHMLTLAAQARRTRGVWTPFLESHLARRYMWTNTRLHVVLDHDVCRSRSRSTIVARHAVRLGRNPSLL
jgi:hypothetical protein